MECCVIWNALPANIKSGNVKLTYKYNLKQHLTSFNCVS